MDTGEYYRCRESDYVLPVWSMVPPDGPKTPCQAEWPLASTCLTAVAGIHRRCSRGDGVRDRATAGFVVEASRPSIVAFTGSAYDVTTHPRYGYHLARHRYLAACPNT